MRFKTLKGVSVKNQNDDLKIDISEIFGENWEPPKPGGPSQPVTPSEPAAETTKLTAEEAEQAFLEWRAQRDRELEDKTRELEKQIQEAQDAVAAEVAAPATGGETVVPPDGNPVQAEVASPVDFNAPIAPPFAGVENAIEATRELDPQRIESLKKLQQEYEFLMLYDEFRSMLIFELKDLVGERKTLAMLERSVEMTREKHPEIFRNANWDSSGNLLEGGCIDSQRIIENKNALDSHKADMMMDLALSGLLKLRFQAVEKGLGTGLRNKIRARFYNWIGEKIQKAVMENKDINNLQRLQSYL
jgi:hypothetical protein